MQCGSLKVRQSTCSPIPTVLFSWVYSCFLILVCLVLVLAAYGKLSTSQSLPNILLSSFEFMLAGCLIFVPTSKIVTMLGAVTFYLFAAASLYKLAIGSESCECFGELLSVQPELMFTLNVFAATVFAGKFCRNWYCRATAAEAQDHAEPEKTKEATHVAVEKSVALQKYFYALALTIVGVFSIVYMAYDAQVKAQVVLGPQLNEDVAIVYCLLNNESDEIATVVSAISSCSCVTESPKQFPVSLMPGEIRRTEFTIRLTKDRALPTNQRIRFFVKSRNLSRLDVPLMF